MLAMKWINRVNQVITPLWPIFGLELFAEWNSSYIWGEANRAAGLLADLFHSFEVE